MKSIYAALVMLCASISVSFGENLVMPMGAQILAERYGCEQISDFYKEIPGGEIPGYKDPPFVWGYATGKGTFPQDSIAFWCKDKKTKELMLVVHMKPQIIRDNPSLDCPAVIRGISTSGGLSLIFDKKITLDEFYKKGKKGPKNVHMTHNGIKSEEDASAEVFYCYKGNWISLSWH